MNNNNTLLLLSHPSSTVYKYMRSGDGKKRIAHSTRSSVYYLYAKKYMNK